MWQQLPSNKQRWPRPLITPHRPISQYPIRVLITRNSKENHSQIWRKLRGRDRKGEAVESRAVELGHKQKDQPKKLEVG